MMKIGIGGVRMWMLPSGVFHRSGGPASEFPDGSKFWFSGGLLHRVGGPAVERADGTKEWWRHGVIREPRGRER